MRSVLDKDTVESSGLVQSWASWRHISFTSNLTSFPWGSETGMKCKEYREWMGC